MLKTNKWVTPKGAKIEFVTEEITSKTVDADGHKIEIETDEILIKEIIINGKSYHGEYTVYKGIKAVRYGWQGKDQLLVAIPDNVYQDVWGEYNRRAEKRAEARAKANEEYEEHYNKVMKMMNI